MNQDPAGSTTPQETEASPGSLLSQLNWLNVATWPDSNGICEYPLFSDAHITGEQKDGFGPYKFLNTVPIPNQPGEVNAPIVLRVAFHLESV